MRLVTIAAFSRPAEAHIARIRLESEGIKCVLDDENAGSWNPFSIALGGVKLRVRAEDAERAREVFDAEPGEREEDSGPSPE